jgi:hypothetical protein
MFFICLKTRVSIAAASTFFVLTTLLSTAAFADSEQNPVITVGSAPSGTESAQKQALNQAFRTAIEQVVGIHISAETIVKHYTVLKDEIYTHSEGFVEKWDVLEESTEAGMLTLKVKSWVREGQLNKALFLNGLDVKKIYTWIGEPRVLILMQEFVDGKSSELELSQTDMENIFIEKGVDVFHGQQLESIKERDKTLAFNDAEKAVTLGKRLGVEIVVSGKCIANFSREIQIGQFKQNFYSAIVQVRAYSTASGKLIHSANYSGDKGLDTSAMGKFDAAVNAIKNTINASKSDILFNIVKNWYDSFSKPKTYQVIVSPVDYEQLESLKNKLYGFEGFSKLFVRSFNNNVAEMDVRYESLRGDLPKAIITSGLPYRITRQEQDRIVLELKK